MALRAETRDGNADTDTQRHLKIAAYVQHVHARGAFPVALPSVALSSVALSSVRIALLCAAGANDDWRCTRPHGGIRQRNASRSLRRQLQRRRKFSVGKPSVGTPSSRRAMDFRSRLDVATAASVCRMPAAVRHHPSPRRRTKAAGRRHRGDRHGTIADRDTFLFPLVPIACRDRTSEESLRT